ncbi:MAG: hypothetical protein EPN93_15370 [Spirochaetes bacterium]|nr:MAG: hypothetical protein EPN93_15370 [Spirochaetota bacterium]
MKCEAFMRKFLELDDGRRLPLAMMLHVRRCAHCRAEVDAFNLAARDMRSFEPYVMDELAGAHLVHRVLSQPAYRKSVSLFNWVWTGVLLFASIFLVQFSEHFVSMRGRFGGDLEVPFSIVMGIVVSVYAAMLIGTHMEEITRWKEHRK